jgi:tetratricopeptide (TPR) repeat protein
MAKQKAPKTIGKSLPLFYFDLQSDEVDNGLNAQAISTIDFNALDEGELVGIINPAIYTGRDIRGINAWDKSSDALVVDGKLGLKTEVLGGILGGGFGASNQVSPVIIIKKEALADLLNSNTFSTYSAFYNGVLGGGVSTTIEESTSGKVKEAATSISIKGLFSKGLKQSFNVKNYIPKLRNKEGKFDFSNSNSGTYKALFWVFAAIIMVSMLFMQRSAGISGDEFTQHDFSDKIIDYYTTDDTSALYQPKTFMHFYGSSFDTFCNVVARTIGTEKVMEVRHFVNAFFGFLAILFAGLLAFRLSNYRTAIIALVFLFFTPRFLGHSFNNPKDIPYALGYVTSIYFMIRMFSAYPKINYRAAIWLVFALAFSLSIRVGAVLNMAMVGAMLFFVHLATFGLKNGIFGKKGFSVGLSSLITVLSVVILGYLIGLLPWPYGLHKPFENPMKAFKEFAAFSTGIRQLFEGQNLMSDELPKRYLSKYLFMTTPIIILVGSALFAIFSIKSIKSKMLSPSLLMVIFAFAFPVVYIFMKGSNVYGGLRHILFIIPMLTILAALGFDYLYSQFGNKKGVGLGVTAIIILGLALPLKHIVKNHPFEYVYFNELSGGMKNAYGKFDNDYYNTSHKEATEWLVSYIKENDAWNKDSTPVEIVSNFYYGTKYYLKGEDRKKIKNEYCRYYEKSQHKWDYFIMNNVYINTTQLINKDFPPVGTIHTIEVDGYPICAVIKRPSTDDLTGYQLYKAQKYDEAIPYFEKYLKVNPRSEEVLNFLAFSYLNKGDYESALKFANQSLVSHPEYFGAYYTKGQAYLNKGNFNEAYNMYAYVTKKSKDNFGGFYYRAVAEYNLKQFDQCLNSLDTALALNPNFVQGYQMAAQILRMQGKTHQAEQVEARARQLGN